MDISGTLPTVCVDIVRVLSSTQPSPEGLQRCNQAMKSIVKKVELQQRQMLDTQEALVREASDLKKKYRGYEQEEAKERAILEAKEKTLSQMEEELERANAQCAEQANCHEREQTELRKALQEKDDTHKESMWWMLLPIAGPIVGIIHNVNADKKVQEARLRENASRENLQEKQKLFDEISCSVYEIRNNIVELSRKLQSVESKEKAIHDSMSTITQEYQTSCHIAERVKFIFYSISGYQEAVGSVLKFKLPKSLLSSVCEPLRYLLTTQLSNAAQYCQQHARKAIEDAIQQLCLHTGVLQSSADGAESKSVICSRDPTRMSDIQLVLTQFCGWEELLVPLPKLHTVLGQLLVRSNDADFSLEGAKPLGGFQHLRYAGSFRSNLLRIVNLGWDALVESKKSMNKMYMLPKALSVVLDELNESLESESRHDLSDLVACIKHMMAECGNEASNMERRFDGIIAMMMELQGCTTAKRGRMEEICQDLSSKHSEEQAQHNQAGKRRRQLFMEMEKVMMSIDEYEILLLETIKVPTIMDDIGRALLSAKSTVGKVAREKKNHQPSRKILESFSDVISEMMEFVEKDDANELNLKGDVTRGAVTTTLTRLDYVEKEIRKSEKSRLRTKLTELCTTGKSICKAVQDYLKQMNQSCTGSCRIAADIIQLGEDVAEIEMELEEKKRVSEKEEKEQGEKQSRENSAYETYTDKIKVKETYYREQLEEKRRRYEAIQTQYRKCQEQLEENAGEMGQLEFQMSDDAATLQHLRTCIKEMAGIRQQWGSFIDLFQQLSSIIECRVAQGLKMMIQMSDSRRVQTSPLLKDLITTEISKMTDICDFVAYIAWNYSLVSDKILMPQANVLQRLVMQKGATQADDISSLAKKGLQAQDAIRNILRDENRKIQIGFVQNQGNLLK